MTALEEPLRLACMDRAQALRSEFQGAGRLQAQGAFFDLVVVDEIIHYEIPRFPPHLRAAIPWIQEAWAE